MNDYLKNLFIKTSWCNPSQDTQFIIKPARVATKTGNINIFQFQNRTYSLPTKNEKYYIFTLNNIPPYLLNLFLEPSDYYATEWVTLSDIISKQSIIINIYNELGILYPLFKVYYIFTKNKTLVIAIKKDSNIPINLELDNIYFRFYSNAYFESLRNNNLSGVEYYTKELINLSDINEVNNQINLFSSNEGYCYCYRNGYLVDTINITNTNKKDTIELVFDKSVKRIVTFNISNLDSFNSTLDDMQKYLLHYFNNNVNMIEYLDDNDIYLTRLINNKSYSVYCHRNLISNQRMITFKDYSISIPFLTSINNGLNLDILPNALLNNKLQLFIRHSGYERELIFNGDLTHELYKLPNDLLKAALLGVNSNLLLWRANELENSMYTELLGALYQDINTNKVIEALGYDAINTYTSNAIIKVNYNTNNLIELPINLRIKSTVYEYDSNGYLIDYYIHQNAIYYPLNNTNCKTIEVIYGIGNININSTYGYNTLSIDTNKDFRVYKCLNENNGHNEDWTDITNSNEYTITNSILTTNDSNLICIKYLDNFLINDLTLTSIDGNLKFPLSEDANRYGSIEAYLLTIPFKDLTIFLNGKSLVEHIDYIIKFPYIVIFNKEHLTNTPDIINQKIHIRYTGFCDANMLHQSYSDIGFIQHNKLSRNKKFDLRDDRVNRITIWGSLVHKDDLEYAESSSNPNIINPLNGKLYEIKDIIQSVKEFTNLDTFELYNIAREKNDLVSAYLTEKLPEPIINQPSGIDRKYQIFSPFICKLIYDLKTSHIPLQDINTVNMSDSDIINYCSSYEEWLDFDPIKYENRIDPRYVSIHPTNIFEPITLNLIQYRFILRVVNIYGNGLIDLSPFLILDNSN